jgi:class 3 adenylate cyclase/ActR/RegA family two-component response regulator
VTRGTSRIATVLFTDLVGSTELFSQLDLAAAKEVRAHHFATLRDALAVHQGCEVKTLGDGMMVVFGSAADGIACAVTMQRAVATYNKRHRELGLSMRIGLSAGETACEQDDFFGAPVVEARRLCDSADPGQIVVADIVRLLGGSGGMHRLEPIGELSLKGLPAPTLAWQVDWDIEDGFALRVAIADDSVLLREGIAKVLEAEGIDVVLQASDAESLLRALAGTRPHVVVVDVRMPPTHTTEGLEAAEEIRSRHPGVGVLVLSASVDPRAARRLLDTTTDGIGYLLKDRVGDIEQLTAAIRTVASGGSAIDPAVIDQLRS